MTVPNLEHGQRGYAPEYVALNMEDRRIRELVSSSPERMSLHTVVQNYLARIWERRTVMAVGTLYLVGGVTFMISLKDPDGIHSDTAKAGGGIFLGALAITAIAACLTSRPRD